MLKLESKTDKAISVNLEKTRLNIGRDPGNDLVLSDPMVSGFHASVLAEDGKIELIDLGSRNGTYLNGKPISIRASIGAWSVIKVGDTELEVIDSERRRPTKVQPVISSEILPVADKEESLKNEAVLAYLEPMVADLMPDRFEIKSQVKIGRSEENHLVLNSPTVSSAHAEILPAGSGIEVVDLQSTNGTYVNGQRATRKTLSHGDRVRFDEVEFRVVFPHAGSAKTEMNPAIRNCDLKTVVNPAVLPPEIDVFNGTEAHVGPVYAESAQQESPPESGISRMTKNIPPDLDVAASPMQKEPSEMPMSLSSENYPADSGFKSGAGMKSHLEFQNKGLKWMLFSVEGRMGRLKYFLGYLAITGMSFVLSTALAVALGQRQMVGPDIQNTMFLIMALNLLFLWPAVCLAVKRLHDLNLSGHFAWLIFFVNLSSIVVSNASFKMVIVLIMVVLGLILLFAPGNREPNRYGLPPAK